MFSLLTTLLLTAQPVDPVVAVAMAFSRKVEVPAEPKVDPVEPAPAPKPVWYQDFAAAKAECLRSGKPLLIVFSTESCVWCRKQEADTIGVDLSGVVPVKFDAADDPSWVRKWGVTSYPTTVVVSPKWKELARHVGYADAAKLTALASHR